MKLRAIIQDVEIDVEIRREAGQVFAKVDGREYLLEANPSPSGVSLLTADGQVFDCRIEGHSSAGQPVDVFVGTDQYAVTLIDPKRLRSAAAANAEADGAARIVAPMPGKVVRVLVEKGASVEAGAGIVVVEAMKMQNEMKAPKAGTVVTLNVEVGATVNGGDVLAVIE
ncbi:MAG: biotin/lipoyl-containing protein [Pyrinomonadaceae bacterium]